MNEIDLKGQGKGLVKDELADKRLTPKEIRDQIYQYVDELGIWNLSHTAIADKLGCHRTTVSKYVNKYIESTDLAELTGTKFAMSKSYEKAIKEMIKVLASPKMNASLKIRAAEALSRVNDGYISFLERFGLKEIMAQKSVNLHGISGEVTIKVIEEDKS